MAKLNKRYIRALERRQHFLERRLATNGMLYSGRDFDRAELSALNAAIELMEEKLYGR